MMHWYANANYPEGSLLSAFNSEVTYLEFDTAIGRHHLCDRSCPGEECIR